MGKPFLTFPVWFWSLVKKKQERLGNRYPTTPCIFIPEMGSSGSDPFPSLWETYKSTVFRWNSGTNYEMIFVLVSYVFHLPRTRVEQTVK